MSGNHTHVKMSADGMRMRNTSGQEVWTSPQRDIVHNFLSYVGKSMQLLTGYMNTNPVFVELLNDIDAHQLEKMVDEFVAQVGAFADIAANRTERVHVTDAAKEAGLLSGDPRFRAAMGYSFFMILLSGYFSGVRSMSAARHNPFAVNDMTDVEQAAELLKAQIKATGDETR